MLIGHSRPTGGVWSVSGAGAAIVGSEDLLDDGRPDTVGAFTWLTGAQTTSSTFRLRYDWTTPIVPRIVGFSNISLPVGTKVQVAFRRTADTAGTYPYAGAMLASSQRIFAGPHGQRSCWLLGQTGMAAIKGVEFQIINDVNGAASIAAAAPFTIGEVFIGAGDDLPVAKGWSPKWSDPPPVNASGSRQGYPGYIEPPYRTLTAKLPTKRQEAFFGDPAALASTDIEELFAKIDRNQVALYVPRYLDANLAFSAQMLHRTALLGVAQKLPEFDHIAGTWFNGGTLQVVEYPIPP